ncbi:hypothetical protein HK104_010452 [Borealophlyctis nickersoniae]|nr:hypothetical protein HK104_010452 [Borealophlyctis nickersoniae]
MEHLNNPEPIQAGHATGPFNVPSTRGGEGSRDTMGGEVEEFDAYLVKDEGETVAGCLGRKDEKTTEKTKKQAWLVGLCPIDQSQT